MNLKNILSISGRPGLYKPVSKGKNMLIVESLSADKKRFPTYNHEKIIALGDIAMYTNGGETPLKDVLALIKEKENGAAASIDTKKASQDELRDYLNTILPDYDREKVHTGDIKKLILWYNNLVSYGITDFQEEDKTEENKAEEVQPDAPAE
ncbi:MAG: DUF5606 domain-containing protein [Mediterranea sp.]|jgi:hypothetical protein|nr:DUF5606 domain-containing protein [Mediterranea sp.]